MIAYSRSTSVIDVLLVVLVSAGAVYSLSTTSAFGDLVGLISGVYAFEAWHVSLALAALATLSGLICLMLPAKPRIGWFFLLILAVCAPSVLAFSSAAEGWMYVLRDDPVLETTMTSPTLLLIALLVLGSYLYLRCAVRSAERTRAVANRGCDLNEVEETQDHRRIWTSIVIVGATVATGLIAATSRLIQHVIEQYSGGVPLEAVVVGLLFCVVAVGIVYLLLARMRLSASATPEEREKLALADFDRALELDEADKTRKAAAAYKLALETGKACETLGGWEVAARAALNLGIGLDQESTHHAANKAYEQSLEAGQASGTPEGLESAAQAALYLSRNLEEAGKVQEAIEAYQEALQLAEASGTFEGQVIAGKAERALLGAQQEKEQDAETKDAPELDD